MIIDRMRYIFIVCISLLLCACSVEDQIITVSMQPVVKNIKGSNRVIIIDRRHDKAIGRVGSGMIQVSNLIPWLKYNFAMSLSQVCKANKSSKLVVHLQKIYVDTDESEVIGVIVARINYYKNNQKLLSKLYRGESSSVNWFGGSSDAAKALNEALNSIQVSLVNNICQLH